MAQYIKFAQICEYQGYEIETGVNLNDSEIISFISKIDDPNETVIMSHISIIPETIHSWCDLMNAHSCQVQELIKAYLLGAAHAKLKKEN